MQIIRAKTAGFCFGVDRAVKLTYDLLAQGRKVATLGPLIHNAQVVADLEAKGAVTCPDIDAVPDGYEVIIRSHGVTPDVYRTCEARGIPVIDATCPVVLRLQKRIKQAYDEGKRRVAVGETPLPPLILIYGKEGHAEVNGLVGQTEGTAIVIQNADELDGVDLSRDIMLYSQTTKSLEGFQRIVEEIRRRKKTGGFQYFDTICRQVATRLEKMRDFAASHDVVVFVSGAKSSNGKVLCEECRKVNPRTYSVTEASELRPEWVAGAETVGICGATSTPGWLMEEVAKRILNVEF